MAEWIIGVDVGGTFTDFAARHSASGRTVVHKRPSTPHDPGEAVLAGLGELQEKAGIDATGIARLGHGTTVATNALLQRRGAAVGVVTTTGFRDLLEIGRQVRPKVYDMQIDAPPPLAERRRRFEIAERVGARGEVVRPLSEADLSQTIEQLRVLEADGELESVAICLLFSFLNPTHEERVAAAVRQACPSLLVSASHEVQPEFREYERFSTTLINAFLQPEVGRYLNRLSGTMAERAPHAAFGIFQSSGGLMSAERAAAHPVRTALSGPAAGAVGAAAAARLSDISDVITLDMGGTSTDVCLIREGRADLAAMRDIAGFRIRLPSVDIHTVGAGGGSIAHVALDGLLRVGPQSAGAVPGPACYGHGGQKATVSDANVILGRLPKALAGGGLTLDAAAAEAAVADVAGQMGLGLHETALGIAGLVASNMTRAIRAVSIEKGYDPRAFALMPFGGAGGLHAADVARALGMRRILVPYCPGILCAEGLIVADLQEDFVATRRCALAAGLDDLLAAAADLGRQGRDWLRDEGAADAEGTLILSLDMRYVGQNYELPVEVGRGARLPPLGSAEDLAAAFFAAHEKSYGHHDPAAPVEVVNLRLRAVLPLAGAAVAPVSPTGAASPIGTQPVWFDARGAQETPVWERAVLPAGHELSGPAIVAQFDATTLVPPDARLRVDDALNLVMEMTDG
ncbi:MAG: hydantoinase/oxoprolinase family protein [Pseudomonadota bacterium]